MELMYPILVIVCLIFVAIIFFIKPKKKQEYTDGKKVANTKYIENTDYYKKRLRRYKILSNGIKLFSILCIITSSILASRIVKIQNKSDEKYNRDIIIGLDISTSQCEVNLEFAKKMKNIIPSLNGDRIGIVIFNTAPIVYCPLTDDYNYVDQCLKTVEEQSEIVAKNNGMVPFSFDENGVEARKFWSGGVLANNEEKGSSLIGDGLAGTLYSFIDLKTNKDRTRIIVFATDNALSGTETISLGDACLLCKKYNVNMYAYCPTVQMNKYTSKDKIEAYRKAIEENAGGEFYTGDLEKATTDIVNKIKQTKTSYMKTSKKTYITDYPEKIFIVLLMIFIVLIILEKRIKV